MTFWLSLDSIRHDGSEVMNTLYQPEKVTPPGETVADLLEERKMTSAELARSIGQPVNDVDAMIDGRRALTVQLALQLEQLFGVPSTYWLAHEAHYRASKSDLGAGKEAADA